MLVIAKKADYDAKISDIGKKYFTTSDYNKFTNDILDTKIKNKKLVNEFHISVLINNTGLDEKIKKLTAKEEVKVEQYKIVKL